MIFLSVTPWWYIISSKQAINLKIITCCEEFPSHCASNLFVCFSKVTFCTQNRSKKISAKQYKNYKRGDSPFECQYANAIQITMVVQLQRAQQSAVPPRDREREQKFRKFSQFVVWIYTRCSGTEVEFLCEPHVGTLPILILFVHPCLCLMMKYLSSTSSSQGKTCLCHPSGYKHGLPVLPTKKLMTCFASLKGVYKWKQPFKPMISFMYIVYSMSIFAHYNKVRELLFFKYSRPNMILTLQIRV